MLMKLVMVLLRWGGVRERCRDYRMHVGSDVNVSVSVAVVVTSFAMHSLRLIAHIAQITQMLSITWHRRRLGRRRLGDDVDLETTAAWTNTLSQLIERASQVSQPALCSFFFL